MARGSQAKLRRRNRKKEDEAVTDMFNLDDSDDKKNDKNTFTEEIPLPPGMSSSSGNGAAAVEDDDSDDDGDDDAKHQVHNLPKKNKKKNKSGRGSGSTPQRAPKKEGIKTLPLIFLILMTGTTLIPAFIYAGDYVSAFLAKNDIAGSIGYRLGIGQVPRKRVMSFYEKHAPEKVSEVPTILAKYYGDYPKLIRKLERKYQDYGYFLGWEEDEAAKKMIQEYFSEAYSIWIKQWNRFAPQVVKTAARNAKYNLTTVRKKFYKLWKKQLWPILEPIFGVPQGTEKQKRKDAYEAKQRRAANTKKTTGTRRKNRDFRDDIDDEH